MTRKEYLLGLLAEEALEVAHSVHKALRFGLDETQPGYTRNNRERIMEEIMDFIVVVAELQQENILPEDIRIEDGKYTWLEEHAEQKKLKINKYLEYSTKQGIING